MMKANIFLTLLFLGYFSWLNAQFVQSYQTMAGGVQIGRTDTSGNVYMAVSVYSDTLGGIGYPNPNSTYFGIAKFDKYGLFQWANMATSMGGFEVMDMDVDGGGNIVFTGWVYDSIRWGGLYYEPLNVVGAHDEAVIGLIDSTGTLQWLQGLHTYTYGGTTIGFLPNGDIVWGVGYLGSASLNGYVFPTSTSYEGYLLTIDRNGIVQNAHHLDAVGDATILDAVGGPNQDLWFSGTFTGDSATFLGTTIQGDGANYSTFLGRVDATGNLQWITSFELNNPSLGELAVDAAGNCYFAGGVSDTVRLGGVTMAVTPTGSEMMAGRLNPNGSCSWLVASQSLSNLSFLSSVDYHPTSGLLCWGLAQYGTGTFAGLPFSAGQNRTFLAVLDSNGVGAASILLDTTIGVSGYQAGQWADTGTIFFAGIYSLSGPNLLGTTLPAPPNLVASFAANISLEGNRLMGKVYADLDQNGAFGPGDVHAPFHPVALTSGLVKLTDTQGEVEYIVGPGPQTISTTTVSSLYTVSPPIATVNFTGLNDVDSSTVFRLVPTSIVPDLRIDLLAPTAAQPGRPHGIQIFATNMGSQTTTATMTLDLDPGATLLSANPAPDTVSGSHLAWNTGPFTPFGYRMVSALVHLDSLLAMNDTVVYGAGIQGAVADFDTTNQADTAKVLVVTSFDPNEKTVSPPAASSTYVNAGGKLRYVVRFQNTGNAPAHRVIIRDTLPSHLDAAGFRFVGASHPVSVRLYEGQVLHFVFDPIYLPDSSSNELLSHGYAIFEVPTGSGLVSGDSITNRVRIYFDYNAPVLTDAAVFHVLDPIDGLPGESSPLSVLLYPNPGAEMIHIEGLAPRMFPVEVSLVDVQGRVLLQRDYRSAEGEVELGVLDLAAGVYVVKVATADGRVEAFRWVGR